MRGDEARWKIEKTRPSNTLKNQGYNFEHNYGHGTQNLSVVFAILMMLASWWDQAQQLCWRLFQRFGRSWAASALLWSGCSLFSRLCVCVHAASCSKRSWYGFRSPAPIVTLDSS